MGNGTILTGYEGGTWGAAPSSWFDIEAGSGSDFKNQFETLQWRGMRQAGGAPRASGRRHHKEYSTGTLNFPFYSNGLSHLLRCAATTASSGVHSGGTNAYDQVYEFGNGPALDVSFTAEKWVDTYDGTYDVFTYPGQRVTQLELGQGTDGFLMVTLTSNGLPVVRQGANPSRSATQVDPDTIFMWEDATITITPSGGSAVVLDGNSLNLALPVDMLVDGWTIHAGTAEVQRLTKSGTISGGTFQSLTVLGVAIEGVAYDANAATWQAAALAAGVPAGSVTFSGGPLSGSTPLDITYAKRLGNVATAAINTTGITGGGSVSVSTPTPGVRRGRRQPKAKGTPVPTGSIAKLYDGADEFDAWIAGTEYSLTAVWEGSTPIEGTTVPSLTVEIPSLFFSGDDVAIDIDNPNQHNLPFEITDNETDPPVTWTLVTSDTAL